MRRLKRLVCDEGASELVEFALSASILFMLIFGIIELCMLVYAGSFVAFAAPQGARYWMVRGADWAGTCSTTLTSGCQAASGDVQNYVLSLPHPGINLTASNITATPLNKMASGVGTCATAPYSQGCEVQVTVTYSFGMQIPFIRGAATIPLSSTSIETIQD
jgi:Flp pilus assembly protein TadG